MTEAHRTEDQKTGPTCESEGHLFNGFGRCVFCSTPAPADPELTDEQRQIIDQLASSISKLCHRVIAKRLEQFATEILKAVEEKKP